MPLTLSQSRAAQKQEPITRDAKKQASLIIRLFQKLFQIVSSNQ